MIDKNIKVGRIALLESYQRDGFFRGGGIIVAVTSKSVKYDDGKGDNSSVRLVRASTVAAVCDTADEAQRLLDFNRRALAEHYALSDCHKTERDKFFNTP